MTYSEELADRVRGVLGEADVAPGERKMFGGLAFMVDGHMAVGIVGDELMVRVGEDGHQDALAEPHTREMDFTGTPMRTMVFVEPTGVEDDTALTTWVERALGFVRTLPPK